MTKRILLIISAVLLLPGLCYATTPEIVNGLLAAQDYENALVQADEGLQADPDNQQLMLQRGFILIKTRNLEEAEKHYVGLIALIPDNPEPMNNLGVIYMLQQDYGKAVAQLNSTIQRFPGFTRAYENLGDTYIQIATANYAIGRDRSPKDKMLISKTDLGQRFYQLAQQNVESSVEQFALNNREATETENVSAEEIRETEQVVDSPVVKDRNIEQEIASFLRSWVNGWSSRKVENYFSHYGKDFKPSGNLSLRAWMDRKTQIIGAAEFIKIRIEGIKIVRQEPELITLEFSQHYESNTYKNQSQKNLILKRYDSTWLIVDEV